jgi:BolA protein
MDNSARIELIKERLNNAFDVKEIDVTDESHKHAGHAGAKSGKGHFNLYIVADDFDGKNLLERHRMVYEALGEIMQTEIHALSIKAHTSNEHNQ